MTQSLIERLEKLTGPDREVDRLIAEQYAPTNDPREEAACNGRDYPDLYTSSIDAALTLCPENCGIEIGFPSPGGNGRPWAFVWWGDDPKEPRQIHVNATTLIIALCAASLRARAVLEDKERG